MTQPLKPCQAPGCARPIPAERLRRHPSTKTCSDDCRHAYRRATMSRPARHQRAKDRQAEAAREKGWPGWPGDHYLRFSCSRSLKYRFDHSIPKGHTAAAWLREILVTLMRTKGLRTWALNERVAVPGYVEREADLAHGSQTLRSRIPALLWDAIGQRAKKEQATPATNWLRTRVYRAVSTTEDWFPQTEKQRFALEYAALRAAGRADPYFHGVAERLKPYEPGYHPLNVQGQRPSVPEYLLAARPPVRYENDPEAYKVYLEGLVQSIIGRCTDQPPLDRCTKQPSLPPGAPQPKSQKEWAAAATMMQLPLIWMEWSAADRDKTGALQDQGRLYQEMLTAEQNAVQVERTFLVRGMVPARVRQQIRRDGLLWASLAD